jgi:hypothetical protein
MLMIRVIIAILAALTLASCTYAPRSTKIDNTYTARQIAVGMGDQPNGSMTSTTHEDEVPVSVDAQSKTQQTLKSLNEKKLNQFEAKPRGQESVIGASKFITIGSTKNDVVRIQGTPTSINKYESLRQEMWHYGYSSITLKNGLVYEWSNTSSNLKVKM